MTEQQRRAIEILNSLREEKSLSNNDYFFLLSFIIDKPNAESNLSELKEFTYKELSDGEVFEYKGKHLRCTEDEQNTCLGCYFENKDCVALKLPICNGDMRTDGKNVIFVEEKGK